MEPNKVTMIIAKSEINKHVIVQCCGHIDASSGDIIEIYDDKGDRHIAVIVDVAYTNDHSDLYNWLKSLPSITKLKVTKLWTRAELAEQ